MLIEEQKFRKLCRGENGGFEGQRFQEALDEDTGKFGPGMVLVKFDVAFSTEAPKKFVIPTTEVEGYAEMARQERQPEEDLLFHIKPQMRNWIRINREAMCARLRKSLEAYSPEHHNGVTIIWPTQSPDKLSYEIVKKYLETYGPGEI